MDQLSPSYLRDGVTFAVRRKGYDPEQVDRLLDRAAGELERLRSELEAALRRAVAAEAHMAESGETDQALRRTLLLAQRTADLATSEAQEAAARTLDDARQRGAALVAEAQETARRIALDAQCQLREDIARLEAARSSLSADVDALARYVEQERERLRSLLSEQLHQLSNLTPDSSPPACHELDLPPSPRETAVPVEAEAAEVAAEVGSSGASHPEEPDKPEGPIEKEGEQAGVTLDLREPGGERTSPATQSPSGGVGPRLRDAPPPRIDPFTAEAATAQEPLGPSDERPVGAPVAELDLPGSRWGLRRRR